MMSLPDTPLDADSGRQSTLNPGTLRWVLLVVTCLGLTAGCRAPIGVERTSMRAAYKQLNETALTLDMSDDSRLVLLRFDLVQSFRDEPDEALLQLHRRATEDDRRDLLFALAELCYLRGEQVFRSVRPWEPKYAPDHFLASAIYAYLYLLGPGTEPPPDPYDRRFRVACDLYNRSVARAFAEGRTNNTVVRVHSGLRSLPQGNVRVGARPPTATWGLEGVTQFLPADEFRVRGLNVRDRQSGLGAPLIAIQPGGRASGFLRPIPATLFLRVSGDVQTWSRDGLSVRLELYDTYETAAVEVGGVRIPLEGDTSAPLAYGLNNSFVWDLGLDQFFSYEEKIPSDIHFTQPYAPGRIPVVFVHGTFSSPVWWAQMWNTLRNDRQLRERYQFWHFAYNSGNPIAYSAANLRRRILETIEELDPTGTDPALQQMVVIGHSQGGLLTKLTVTDTGDKLWRAYFDTDFEDADLRPEVKEKVREYAFIKPLPCVKRVVFLSTPHRGSYLANSFVRQVTRWFMDLPGEVMSVGEALVTARQPSAVPAEVRKSVPTSLDQMSPKNVYLLALAEIPVAPGVQAHSIIGVKGGGPIEDGADGVVKYASAHVDYVESELVLRCGHGTQTQPAAIEEVRRILLEHLDVMGAASP